MALRNVLARAVAFSLVMIVAGMPGLAVSAGESAAGRVTYVSYSGPTQALAHDTVSVKATVTDASGRPIPDLLVTFSIGEPGSESAQPVAEAVTGSDGVANGEARVPAFPAGTYEITASHAGTRRWLASADRAELTILPATSSISLSGASSGYVGELVTLGATLTRFEGGIPLGGQRLWFALEDDDGAVPVRASATTDAGGNASVTFRLPWRRGTYARRVSFDGLYSIGASSASATFGVIGIPTGLMHSGATSPPPGQPFYAAATLYANRDGSGCVGGCDGLGDQLVYFELSQNGAIVDSATDRTNSSGDALVMLEPASEGPATLTMSFAGDDTFLPVTSEVRLSFTRTVSQILPYTSPTSGYAGEHVDVVANLHGGSGHNSGRILTFAVMDGDEALWSTEAITNEFGTARGEVFLPAAGTYTLVVSFAGDATFAPSSSSWPIEVLRSAVTLAHMGPDTARTLDEATLTARLALATTGAGVTGRAVSFKLARYDGEQLAEAQGVSGVDGDATASMTLDMPALLYELTETFAGDESFAPASVTTQFYVSQRSVHVEYTGPTSAKRGSMLIASAVVVDDATGDGVPNLRVGVALGDYYAFGDTNDEGRISLELYVAVAPGTHQLRVASPSSAHYEGTENFVPVEVGWPYVFTDVVTGAQLRLDFWFKQIQFVAPGYQSGVKNVPSMVATGTNPVEVVLVAFQDDDLTVAGEFPLYDTPFVGIATAGGKTYTLTGV